MKHFVFLLVVAATGCTLTTDLEGLSSVGAGGGARGGAGSGAGGGQQGASSVASGAGGSGGEGIEFRGGCLDPLTCDTCLKRACESEYTSCTGSACGVILACVYACPCDDELCWKACYRQHALGQADYAALSSCALTATCSDCAPQL